MRGSGCPAKAGREPNRKLASHLFGLTKDIVAYPRKGKCELRDVSTTFSETELSYLTRSNEILGRSSFQSDSPYDVQILTH